MAIQKLKGGRVNNAVADDHIGDKGSLFYNEDLGDLRLSDGITKGGIPLTSVASGDSVPALLSSTAPAVGRPGSMWYCTATNTLYISQNGAWEPISSPDGDDLAIGHGLKVDQNKVLAVDVDAIIVPATTTSLGHITVGDGLVVDSAGRLSVNIQSYQLPQATTSSLGGVIIGDGLSVDSTGKISANTQPVPMASTTVLGGIRIGEGFTVDVNGVLGVANFVNTDGGSVSTNYGGISPLDGGGI
jgi:hypothetical protein